MRRGGGAQIPDPPPARLSAGNSAARAVKKMRFFCFTAGANFIVLESFLIQKEMQKTKKSIAKRFKITASGKVLRRSPGKRHLLVAKSVKQKRAMGHDKPVTPGIAAIVKKAVPFA